MSAGCSASHHPGVKQLAAATHHTIAHACRAQTALGSTHHSSHLSSDLCAAALREGKLLGAALDVVEHEPLEPDNELWDLPNVLVRLALTANKLPNKCGHLAGWHLGGQLPSTGAEVHASALLVSSSCVKLQAVSLVCTSGTHAHAVAQLTPHCAFKSEDNFLTSSFDIFLELAAQYANGQPLSNRVDTALGY